MKKYGKFGALIVIVVGTLVWLAAAAMNENKTYYKTISELSEMGDRAHTTRLKVAGDVEPGSIVRKGSVVEFMLVQEGSHKLRVAYTGSDPLPDTFRDRAQALADGKMGHDGVFQATKIQAKCASKYAPKPGQARPGEPANLNTRAASY